MTKTTAEFFNGDAVPLAPRLTAFADLTARLPWGLSASATMRYIGNRYADEERTRPRAGYTLFDLGARYRYKLPGSTALDAFVTIENLANVDWREAQFFTTSRLRGEPRPGRDRHQLHAGQPAHRHRRPRVPLLARIIHERRSCRRAGGVGGGGCAAGVVGPFECAQPAGLRFTTSRVTQPVAQPPPPMTGPARLACRTLVNNPG